MAIWKGVVHLNPVTATCHSAWNNHRVDRGTRPQTTVAGGHPSWPRPRHNARGSRSRGEAPATTEPPSRDAASTAMQVRLWVMS
jgi:hypothetical protein